MTCNRHGCSTACQPELQILMLCRLVMKRGTDADWLVENGIKYTDVCTHNSLQAIPC